MRQTIATRLGSFQRSFGAFTTGQKTVAVLGGIALVIGAVLLFRWASTPAYSPLFNNLAPSDASAVVEQLEAEGTPYELADGGATVLVPREEVYDARIRLSGEGLPSEDKDGYGLLDEQDLSTSQFQEQTGYKRAMEGELAKTIEALDPVSTAVVHLALPQEELFADEQEPTTASVLVETRPGSTLEPGQVQAVVHLVASSVEGLDPDQVTVADSTGEVLSASGEAFGTAGDTRLQQISSFENRMNSSVQGVLDRVVGPGNSAVQVTADLNFDKTVSTTTRYFTDPEAVPLSESTVTESYTAPGAGEGAGGVVGPDGMLDPNAAAAAEDGGTAYTKEESTRDNSVGHTTEEREAAPGNVESLHIGIVLDAQRAGNVNANEVFDLVSSAIGIDRRRGDTVEVSVLPFDRTAEEDAAAALEAAKAEEDRAALMGMLKTGGLVLLVLGILLAAWLRGRKRRKARDEATTYVVEQLRRDAQQRQAITTPDPEPLILGPGETPELTAAARDEIAALVERQPEEVAQLLRGWLVEARR